MKIVQFNHILAQQLLFSKDSTDQKLNSERKACLVSVKAFQSTPDTRSVDHRSKVEVKHQLLLNLSRAEERL